MHLTLLDNGTRLADRLRCRRTDTFMHMFAQVREENKRALRYAAG
jgi:hypothetical protein